jgi:cystathionine beta-lyase/cystathionine gamma-synthase
MNLHQFKFVQEAVRRNLNLTEAAKALHTSQPGVSKAIIELEDELGVEIFARHGKRIRRVTEPGQQILKSIDVILREVNNLRRNPRTAVCTFTANFRGGGWVQVIGGAEAADFLISKLHLFANATSLGGVESLIERRAAVEGPDTLTPPNLIRVSVGLEHPDDLIQDLNQAFEALG